MQTWYEIETIIFINIISRVVTITDLVILLKML